MPLYGEGANVRDWLHVDDHCRGIHLVLDGGRPGEVYNIGGGTELSNKELTGLLLEATGTDWDRVERVTDRLGHDLRYSVDITKISTELGYQPQVPFAEGLAETVEWYRDPPLLVGAAQGPRPAVGLVETPDEVLGVLPGGEQPTLTDLGQGRRLLVPGGEQGRDRAAVAGRRGPGDADLGVERVDAVLAVRGVRRRAEVVHDRAVLERHERVAEALGEVDRAPVPVVELDRVPLAERRASRCAGRRRRRARRRARR